MRSGIFSTYRQGENRVTASIVNVLRRLPMDVVEVILKRLAFDEDPASAFFVFKNQSAKNDGSDTVPDAELSANFKILLETKIVSDASDQAQIQHHKKQIGDAEHQRVVLLTPDFDDPTKKWGDEEQKGVTWRDFYFLTELIDSLFTDEDLILSERDQLLLKELQIMLRDEGLLPSRDRVVVVAANMAFMRYEKQTGARVRAYICQPNRTFRADSFAFYAEGKIQPLVARVTKSIEELDVRTFTNSNPQSEIFLEEDEKKAVKECYELSEDLRAAESEQPLVLKVVFLSAPDANETIKLDRPIENDLRNQNTQRRYAYTQGQRYTSLSRLLEVVKENKGTSAL